MEELEHAVRKSSALGVIFGRPWRTGLEFRVQTLNASISSTSRPRNSRRLGRTDGTDDRCDYRRGRLDVRKSRHSRSELEIPTRFATVCPKITPSADDFRHRVLQLLHQRSPRLWPLTGRGFIS